MVFAKHLRLIGDKFRAKYLNSTDNQDQTIYSEDWTRMKVSLWKLAFGHSKGKVECQLHGIGSEKNEHVR